MRDHIYLCLVPQALTFPLGPIVASPHVTLLAFVGGPAQLWSTQPELADSILNLP
jgi:hypothetical protein